jgi:hypothetical protein
MSWQVNRLNAETVLLERSGIDVSLLGNLVLDDQFQRLSVVFFQKMLLCLVGGEVNEAEQSFYPVQPWELGPALKGAGQMNVLQAIPTENFRVLRYDVDGGLFQQSRRLRSNFATDLHFALEWADDCGGAEDHTHTLKFVATSPEQHEQWCGTLQAFVPSVVVPGPLEDTDDETETSDEEPAELLFSGNSLYTYTSVFRH